MGREKLTPGVKPAPRGGVARRQCEMRVVSSMGGKMAQRREKEGWRGLAKGTKKKGRRKSIRNVCKGKKNKAKGPRN